MGQSGAIDFSELHFQQDFLRADRTEGEHVDNILGIGRGQRSGVFGDVLGGYVTGENNRGARRRDGNLFLGEDAMFFFGAGADIDVHAEIEAARAFEFVPDEQRDFARSSSMDQDLGGRDDGRIGHGRIGHRDALDLLGGVDQQGLVDHDAQRSRTLRLSRLRRKRGLGGGRWSWFLGRLSRRLLRQRLG